jgi:hypothetical protein
VPKNDLPSPAAARDYDAKTFHETARLARQAARAGLPQPFGDPLSGVVLVAEPATEPTVARRMVDALQRSLTAVKLDRVYVIWSHPDLAEEILSLEPDALVAVGPTASRAIDSCNYPLAKMAFLEATEGSWFAWTKGTRGLRLPALAPALDNADAKRRFWAAFLALRTLVPDDGR